LCADSTCGLSDYPQRVARSCFHLRLRFLEPTVPRPSRIGFIPSCRNLPFGVSSSALLAAPFGAAVLPGFRPSSRHHLRHGRARAFPGLVASPSSGFLSPSTVLVAAGFAGLLHPAATSRVRTVQGILPPHSRPGSSPGRAPVSLSLERSPASRLPPSGASTSRPCSVRAMRSSGSGVNLPCGRSPLRFHPPSGPGYPSWSRFPRGLHS
jgi:hypothetical protein